jgi:membrane protease YdiL (CAAX protease family)
MSFFAAAMWSTSALIGLDLMSQLLAAARSSERLDLVSGVLCQCIAFMGALFFMILKHDRDRPVNDVLGMRRTPVVLCLFALAIGIALHGPLTLISNAIISRFPHSQHEIETIRQLLSAPTTRHKIALFAAAGLLGPLVEEMFFRGAILRNLRRRHSSSLTLLGVSLLFAAAHLDLRNFLPDFLGGLAMGYARILSGSLWPAVLLHAAFNSGSVFVAVSAGPDADLFTVPESLAAVLATLALVGLYATVALRSELCAEARDLDVT